jgi:sugar transferase EpsL
VRRPYYKDTIFFTKTRAEPSNRFQLLFLYLYSYDGFNQRNSSRIRYISSVATSGRIHFMHQAGNESLPLSKRLLDLTITLPGFLILAPILLIIAILVRLRYGSPVIFRQKRPGYKGKPFWIYKFRTMTNVRDADNILLPDNERITRLGHFLRSSSLDEFPELFNVLRGEMSLVGPRPLLMQYLERYSPEQARRHNMLPGITGWAQINGRNALTWEEKFNLDVWYIDHWSILLDIQILLKTAIKVLRRESINQPGHATAEEFMGSHDT